MEKFQPLNEVSVKEEKEFPHRVPEELGDVVLQFPPS